jgi:protein-tyrosine phosphatase
MSFSFLKHKKSFLKEPTTIKNLVVDFHAHVLPNLDNGPSTTEEAIALLRTMSAQGVRKVIATPHIMGDFYKNTIETITSAKRLLERELRKRNETIQIDIAAEYYLDVALMATLESENELISVANQYFLFETTVIGMPSFLFDAVAIIKTRGLTPVLAHPERYQYLQQNYDLVLKLKEEGVLFQINLPSFNATHAATQKLVTRIVENGLASFVGSNVHRMRDWGAVTNALGTETYQIALQKGLLNESLL